MLTSRQGLAGRALLDWIQQLLAENAGATLTMLKRLESDRLAMRDAIGEAMWEDARDPQASCSYRPRRESAMLVRRETKKPEGEA